MSKGADPNGIGDYDQTPLQRVLDFKWADHRPYESEEQYQRDLEILGPTPQELIAMIDVLVEAGAHVDWAAPNECTPLAEACLHSTAEVVTHLLELGADPSIRCHDDEYPSEAGTAWDFAAMRCDGLDEDRNDESLWNALAAVHKEPWGDLEVTDPQEAPTTLLESVKAVFKSAQEPR